MKPNQVTNPFAASTELMHAGALFLQANTADKPGESVMDQDRAELIQKLSETEPEKALQISDQDRADYQANLAVAQHEKTRRLKIIAGATVLTLAGAGIGVSAPIVIGLYEAHKAVSAVGHALKGSLPQATYDEQSQSILRAVGLDNDPSLSYGIVKSTDTLNTDEVACPQLIGVPCTDFLGKFKANYQSTVVSKMVAVLPKDSFTYGIGHSGAGKLPTDYYPTVAIDPSGLYPEQVQPAARDLKAARLSADTPYIHNAGKPGALQSLSEGVAGVIGMSTTDPSASAYTYTDKQAFAGVYKCASSLDPTLTAGAIGAAKEAFTAVTEIIKATPKQYGAINQTFLSDVLSQPIRVTWKTTKVSDDPKVPTTTTYIAPADVHFYGGPQIQDIHTAAKHAKGNLKTQIDETSSIDDECQVSPAVIAEETAIELGKTFVYDYPQSSGINNNTAGEIMPDSTQAAGIGN